MRASVSVRHSVSRTVFTVTDVWCVLWRTPEFQSRSLGPNCSWRLKMSSQSLDYFATTSTEVILLLFGHSVVSDSLRPHGPQHARLSCPSLAPRICSDSCRLSRWCYLTISSSVASFSCLQSFPASGSFLCFRWPVCWSFSISSSNE